MKKPKRGSFVLSNKSSRLLRCFIIISLGFVLIFYHLLSVYTPFESTYFSNRIFVGNVSKSKGNQPLSLSDIFHEPFSRSNDFSFASEYPIDLNFIRNASLIFIGGFGRSGTTLVRAILDVHPNIYCGAESKILPSMLSFITGYLSKRNVIADLAAANISTRLIDDSLLSFIYHILNGRVNHKNSGKNVTRLCVKDPNILLYASYLHRLFPNAKFLYMIRDGRAAAYSYMKRVESSITFSKYLSYLSSWDNFNRKVDTQCKEIGPLKCLMVKYESLIIENKKTLESICVFLSISWTNQFLNHHNHFSNGTIQVSHLEWSTDQIKKPLYNDSVLNPEWKRKFIGYNYNAVLQRASLLTMFGYNTSYENWHL